MPRHAAGGADDAGTRRHNPTSWKAQHAAGERIGSDDHYFHFGSGMAMRNLLRAQLTDDELPPVHAEGYPPEGARNWDDYYIGALQELCETAP